MKGLILIYIVLMLVFMMVVDEKGLNIQILKVHYWLLIT